MTSRRSAPPELAELHDECVARGYLPGLDFFVVGVPGFNAGDGITIRREGQTYIVVSEDNGRPHDMLRTSDFERAREHFLTEVGWGAGFRGHGPYAGRSRLEEAGWTTMTLRERTIRVYRDKGLPIPAYLLDDSDDATRRRRPTEE
ncbi:hypothetical protein [Cellulomonas soli]|uniref:Uncharacterized protein n=1 Tax=Cellulomonas soli TaxID=931535 RepID=A0A512PG46_9CELL|nr:hypothetical protein [Cellulomonas soli]NYI58018.1 hypothetical protein [Cellulomonas soli]GEP70153.1 hypothetical protein CSO01_28680 [Cellulomonas soli]